METPRRSETHILLEGDRLFAFDIEGYLSTQTFMEDTKEEQDTYMKKVPSHYHDYKDVFDQKGLWPINYQSNGYGAMQSNLQRTSNQ